MTDKQQIAALREQTMFEQSVSIAVTLSMAGSLIAGGFCPGKHRRQADSAPAAVSARALADMMHALEEWQGYATEYSHTGWEKLVRVAGVVQACPPETVEEAIDLFMSDPADKGLLGYPGTKPFLLLRAVFDLPEDAPVEQDYSLRGYLGSTLPYKGETVNLAWPTTWRGGEPRLVAFLVRQGDIAYKPKKEYRYMLQHFHFRDLRGR